MYLSFELMLLSLIFFVLGMYMYIEGELVYLEWTLVEISGLDFCYQVYFDFYSMMFMSVILLVSCMIFMYSYWYIDTYDVRFYYLMLGFMLSMLILVISPNLMGMLLGWDGLGFVSFCLVLFYYNSDVSLSSSLVTLYYNRWGDGFLLVSIGCMLFSLGGCEGMIWDWGLLLGLLMLMGLSTKSAQFPFMSWLPKAMAAPTPVSSLVHSSTLVTAGVYMMIRFFNSVEGVSMLMYVSLLTMFISGILAMLDMDLKKVVAYSTLSQLGLMVFGLCMGMKEFVYFHMLSHAVFKSMMFMSAGILIHELGGWQDIRYYGSCLSCLPVSSMCLLTGSFSLTGTYFLSGFYSKDILIEMFLTNSVGLSSCVVFYFCMTLTLFYSFRLLDYLSLNFISVVYLGSEDGCMSLCMGVLYLGSVVYGWMLSDLVLSFNIIGYEALSTKFYLSMINMSTVFYFLGDYCGVTYMYLNMDMHKLFKNLGVFSFIGFLDKYWVEGYGGYSISLNVYKLIYEFKDYSIYFLFMMAFFFIMFI